MTDVRSRMVETAAVLLAKKGLQGASFSEVLAASGAPRGSIYHHFPGGKDQLVREALEVARQRAQAALEAQRGQPASVVAETFVGLWRSILLTSTFSAGCAVVAITVASDDAELVERAAEVFRGWRSLLADLLREGGVAPERAAGLAAVLVAGCEGAVLVARAERGLDTFEAVAGELLASVAAAS